VFPYCDDFVKRDMTRKQTKGCIKKRCEGDKCSVSGNCMIDDKFDKRKL
jgi:hypothetical protein